MILTREEEAAAMINFEIIKKICIFMLSKPLLNIFLIAKASPHTFIHARYPPAL